MHLGATGRATLLGLACVAAPTLQAEVPSPERSFHLVQKLEGSRLIEWRAIAREPGHFTLWRVDRRVERVGMVEARAGSNTYRFVDPAGSASAFVVYRLTYEGASGSNQVLAIATVAQPGLRGAALPDGVSAGPEALSAQVVWLAPPDTLAGLVRSTSVAGLRLQQPPDPPPPRS